MVGKKNPAWAAINRALSDKGITKKQLEGELLDKFGMAQRTFYHQQTRGYFDAEVAHFLSRRLGIPASVLLEPHYAPPGINDDLILDSFETFREAMKNSGIEISSRREARAYLAYFRQCVDQGSVDPRILDLWLETLFDGR